MIEGRVYFKSVEEAKPPEREAPQAVEWFEDDVLAEINKLRKDERDLADTFGGTSRETRFEKMDRVLNNIDFQLLKTIFEEIAAKCGIQPGSMNFIDKERISKGGMSGDYYDAQKNLIGISYDGLEQTSEELKIDKALVLLPILCHEEGHAVARTECYGTFQDDKRKQKLRSGFQIRPDLSTHKSNFELLDEGVNEKLSREIVLKYLQRDKNLSERFGNDQVKMLRQYIMRGEESVAGRSKTVRFIEMMVDKMSNTIGIQKDTVWMSLVKGRFEGEPFEDQELRAGFAEVFGENFLDELAVANDQAKLDVIIKKYHLEQ